MNMLNTMDGWTDKIIFDPKYFKLLRDEIDALTWSASLNILQKLL